MEDRHAVLLEIMCLANCLSRGLGSLNAERSSAGISGVNAQILGYLAAREGQDIFQRDIEEAFSIRRSTVSKIVRLMETKGLIERRPVERDARLKRLVLTQKAREIYAVAAGEIADFEARATRNLSDQEVQALYALLEKVERSVQPCQNEDRL